MKKNYKLLATLVLSGLAGAAFGVLPAQAAVTVGSSDGTEKSLTGTEFTSLYGNMYTDSTSGNTVSISGEGTVTLTGETVSAGGSSYTASTLAGAYTLESGDASNNKLSVTDGASVSFSNATGNGIAGGISMKGAASGNQVTLSGVSLNLPDATTSSLEIAGGVSGASAADNNAVTLTDLTSSTEKLSITGGMSQPAESDDSDDFSAYTASNNHVTISSSVEASYADITGGYALGNANGNVVSVTSTAKTTDDVLTVSGDIFGGNSESGSAENNEVTLTGNGIARTAGDSTNTLPSIDVEGTIYGGNAAYGNASTNTVSLTQVFASEDIYGGFVESYTTASFNASGNTVSLTNSVADGEVYGGLVATGSSSSSASGNTVTLTNSTADGNSIYGGYEEYYASSTDESTDESAAETDEAAASTSTPAFSARASGNTVTLSNSTARSSDIYGGYMQYYGDTSAEADAVAGVNHNTVTLTNTSASGTRVYGGYVSSSSSAPALNASSNTVEISNTAEEEYGVSTVTGGYTDYGDANDNTVKITGTKVTDDDEIYLTSVSSDITGGETESGNADGNTVTLDTITSSGTVFGGRAGNASSGGGNVAAAAAFTSLLAAPVEESTETDTGTEADSISTSANSNAVTITGSQIEGIVFGGLAGSASSNSGSITYLTSLLAVAAEDTTDTSTGISAMSISANDNTATIADSTIGDSVYGGYAGVSNSDLYSLEDTPTISLTASGNKVEMTSSTVSGAIYGGLAGSVSSSGGGGIITTSEMGLSSLYAVSSSSDAVYINNANHNSVILKGTQTSSNVYGGYAGSASSSNSSSAYATESLAETSQTASASTADTTGGASYNQVLIEEPAGNETDADTTGYVFSPYVYGGYAVGGTAAVPYHTNGNEVTITYSDTTQLGYYDSVYGGWTDYGDASGNQVSITGAALTGNDTVTTNLELVGDGVNGGTTYNGNADNNTVSLDHVTINSQSIFSLSMPGVIGGSVLTWSRSSAPAILADGTVSTSASGNKVTLTDSVVTNSVSSGSEGPTTDVAGGYVINDGRDYLSSDTTNLAYEAAAVSNQNTVALQRSTAEMVEGGVASEYLMITPELTSTEEETGAAAAPLGKLTVSTTASGNTVTLTDSTVSGDAVGGSAVAQIEDGSSGNSGFDFSDLTISANETASKNIVTLKGSTVAGAVIGGFTTQGTTSQNTVSLNADSTASLAAGGLSEMGTVSENSVLLSDSKADVLLGGYTLTGTASGNTAVVTGGSAASVYGGAAGPLSEEDASALGLDTASMGSSPYTSLLTSPAAAITATGNTVTITGGTIGNVWGGYAADITETEDDSDSSSENVSVAAVMSVAALEEDTTTTTTTTTYNSGNASGNTVNYYGGTVTGDITGGYSQSGTANDNIVNLYATLATTGNLYGGVGASEGTGNTLNVYTKDNSAGNLADFQKLNFYIPGTAKSGDTMLTVSSSDINMENVSVNADTSKILYMNPGDFINLVVNTSAITTDDTTSLGFIGDNKISDANFILHEASIKKDGDDSIILYIPEDGKGEIDPDTKLIPENREAALAALKNAAGNVLDSALGAADAAHDDNDGEEAQFTPYAVVSGMDMHYETGSYIDINGMAANVGFVKKVKTDAGTDTIMPFIEYGRGSYSSHLDDGARGDGKNHYTGAGILVRHDQESGLYYEGAASAGYTKGDFHGKIGNFIGRYESGAPYISAQAGLGKIYTKDRDTYDVYGKFFWTHLGSDSANIAHQEGTTRYDFDSVDSYVTRLGMRWTRNFDQVRSLYAGIGWDYEFDSEARAHYQAFATPSPSMEGGSGFLELGWKSKIDKTHPWGVDLRATGWTGVQEGAAYSVTISHKF